jgi:hypothetical protein
MGHTEFLPQRVPLAKKRITSRGIKVQDNSLDVVSQRDWLLGVVVKTAQEELEQTARIGA